MGYFEIQNASVFSVSGKHAERYLQARLTANIKTLKINGVTAAAQLTPQGKTQGLFRVVRTGESLFILYSDGGDRSALLTSLKKYLVADQVVVEDLTETEGARIFHVTTAVIETLPVEALAIKAIRGFEGEGFDLVCLNSKAVESVRSIIESAPAISPTEQTAARFKAGFPSFPEELNEGYLFSESGIPTAQNKGCYVGQEVVEKIESFGKTAKVLRRIRIMGEHEIASSETIVEESGRTVGQVVSALQDKGETWIFARIQNDLDLESHSLSIKGHEVLR